MENVLSPEESELLYEIYIDSLKGNVTEINGKHDMVERLNKLGLLRKVKQRNKNKHGLMLTHEGFIYAIIMCRLKGNFKANKTILEVFWW